MKTIAGDAVALLLDDGQRSAVGALRIELEGAARDVPADRLLGRACAEILVVYADALAAGPAATAAWRAFYELAVLIAARARTPSLAAFVAENCDLGPASSR